MDDDGGLQFWQTYQQQFAQQLEELENDIKHIRETQETVQSKQD